MQQLVDLLILYSASSPADFTQAFVINTFVSTIIIVNIRHHSQHHRHRYPQNHYYRRHLPSCHLYSYHHCISTYHYIHHLLSSVDVSLLLQDEVFA